MCSACGQCYFCVRASGSSVRNGGTASPGPASCHPPVAELDPGTTPSRVKATVGRLRVSSPAPAILNPRRGTALVPDASSYLSGSSTALDTIGNDGRSETHRRLDPLGWGPKGRWFKSSRPDQARARSGSGLSVSQRLRSGAETGAVVPAVVPTAEALIWGPKGRWLKSSRPNLPLWHGQVCRIRSLALRVPA